MTCSFRYDNKEDAIQLYIHPSVSSEQVLFTEPVVENCDQWEISWIL